MIALYQEPINHPSFSVFLRFDIGLFPQARKGDITQLKLTKGKELKKNKTKTKQNKEHTVNCAGTREVRSDVSI